MSNGSARKTQPSTTAPRILTFGELGDDAKFSIETVSGRYVSPVRPKPETIVLEDMAWALSRAPRYAGHTRTKLVYPVAQHEIFVADLARMLMWNEVPGMDLGLAHVQAARQEILSFDREEALLWVELKSLIHDNHEAYLVDLPSPLKRIPELKAIITELENKLDAAIYEALNIPQKTEAEEVIIKHCDLLALALEANTFMHSRGRGWIKPEPSLALINRLSVPEPQEPFCVYEDYLERYHALRATLP